MITFQDTLDAFFDPQDQDAFARSQGWEDAAQMCYYEDLAMMEQGKSDSIAQIMGYESADSITEELNRMESEVASRPHELQQQDAREVYEEQLDWRLLPRTDWSGVY
jgi:hypothetical protein